MFSPRRLAVLASAFALLAPVPAAHGADIGRPQLGAALPTVADLPGAGLAARSAEPIGADALRAPYPCPAYEAGGMRGTRRWGEWAAVGRGRSVRVLVFAYSDRRIGSVWRDLRAAIRACPRVTRVGEDDGSRGTAVQVITAATADAIRLEIRTRSASGERAWSKDRAIVYQRVGDAIIKAQASRQTLRPADRVLARRVARVSRAKYLAERAEAAGAPDDASSPVAEVDAPLARAVADLPAGARLTVSIGDSMLSGEGGRWRGNVFWHANWAQADAYGDEAYWDTPTGESVRNCHRAQGAPIRIPDTHSLNLACSGATTTSRWVLGDYKPGIDDGAIDPATGRRLPGQMTLLGQVARQAPIGTVVLSIGGNDLGFLDVVVSCVGAFLRPWPFEQRCRDDAATQRRLSDASLAAAGAKVEAAILRVHETMRAAGYADDSWELIVQNYPRLLAEDARYADTYADRLVKGGCPIHSADIPFFNDRLPMTAAIRTAVQRASASTGRPVRFVDITAIFAGRELCAKGAEHVDRMAPSAVVARGERVAMIRVFPPFQMTEGMHPNQLGQQALQACLRQAINGGRARSGRCEAPLDWSRVDATGLPLVRFTSTS
jgi:hypothetical protein